MRPAAGLAQRRHAGQAPQRRDVHADAVADGAGLRAAAAEPGDRSSGAWPGSTQTGGCTLCAAGVSSTRSPLSSPGTARAPGASSSGLSQTSLRRGAAAPAASGLLAWRPSQQARVGAEQQRRAPGRAAAATGAPSGTACRRRAAGSAGHDAVGQRVGPGLVVQPVAPGVRTASARGRPPAAVVEQGQHSNGARPPNSGSACGCWMATVPSWARMSPQASNRWVSGTCQAAARAVSSGRRRRRG